MKDFLIDRLREPSTWRGLVLLLTALGLTLSPEAQEAIIAAGLALAGALGVLLPDPKKIATKESKQPPPVDDWHSMY